MAYPLALRVRTDSNLEVSADPWHAEPSIREAPLDARLAANDCDLRLVNSSIPSSSRRLASVDDRVVVAQLSHRAYSYRYRFPVRD